MDGWVVVYRATGHADAGLIRGYLESEEIPADLYYESAGLAFGLTMNGMGEVRVCVPEAYVEQARQALARRISNFVLIEGGVDPSTSEDSAGTDQPTAGEGSEETGP